MTYPSWLHTTSCLALFTAKFSKLLTPRSESSLIVSGPSIWRSSMWCDWSKRALVFIHETCSSRQFENSPGTAG